MNFGCENNIKRSSRYHPSEFCTKLNYAYTTRQCDEYFEYLDELRRIIFGENYYKMTTASKKSISYHTHTGKTLVYELEDTSNYGISLSSVPSEIVTTETFLAEEHVLPRVEMATVVPPTVSSSSVSSSTDNKLCHHLPMEIEERMRDCLHASAEIISGLSKEFIPTFPDQTSLHSNPYSLASIVNNDDPDSSSEDESDYTDQRGLEENIDEDFAILEDFATVLEESESVFEEVDDYTEDFDDFIISNDEVIEVIHEVEYNLEWPVVISGFEKEQESQQFLMESGELLPSPAAFSTSSWETVIERQLENVKDVEVPMIDNEMGEVEKSSPRTVSSLIQFFESVAQKSRESIPNPSSPTFSISPKIKNSLHDNKMESKEDHALESPTSPIPAFISKTLQQHQEQPVLFDQSVPVENEASTHFSLFSHSITTLPELLQTSEFAQETVGETRNYSIPLVTPDSPLAVSEIKPAGVLSSKNVDSFTEDPRLLTFQEIVKEPAECELALTQTDNEKSSIEDQLNLPEIIRKNTSDQNEIIEDSNTDAKIFPVMFYASVFQEDFTFPIPNERFEQAASSSSDGELLDLISAYVQLVLRTPHQLISTNQEEAVEEIVISSTLEHDFHVKDCDKTTTQLAEDVNEQRKQCLSSSKDEMGCHDPSNESSEAFYTLRKTSEHQETGYESDNHDEIKQVDPSVAESTEDSNECFTCGNTPNVVDKSKSSHSPPAPIAPLPQMFQEFSSVQEAQDHTVHVPETASAMTVEENGNKSIVSDCLISESSDVIGGFPVELIQIVAENVSVHHSTTTETAMPGQDFRNPPTVVSKQEEVAPVEDNMGNDVNPNESVDILTSQAQENSEAEDSSLSIETEDSSAPVNTNVSPPINPNEEEEQPAFVLSLDRTAELPSIPLVILEQHTHTHDDTNMQVNEESLLSSKEEEETTESTVEVMENAVVTVNRKVNTTEDVSKDIHLSDNDEHNADNGDDLNESSIPIQQNHEQGDKTLEAAQETETLIIHSNNLLDAQQDEALNADQQETRVSSFSIPTIVVCDTDFKDDNDDERVEMMRQAVLRSKSIIDEKIAGEEEEQAHTKISLLETSKIEVDGKDLQSDIVVVPTYSIEELKVEPLDKKHHPVISQEEATEDSGTEDVKIAANEVLDQAEVEQKTADNYSNDSSDSFEETSTTSLTQSIPFLPTAVLNESIELSQPAPDTTDEAASTTDMSSGDQSSFETNDNVSNDISNTSDVISSTDCDALGEYLKPSEPSDSAERDFHLNVQLTPLDVLEGADKATPSENGSNPSKTEARHETTIETTDNNDAKQDDNSEGDLYEDDRDETTLTLFANDSDSTIACPPEIIETSTEDHVGENHAVEKEPLLSTTSITDSILAADDAESDVEEKKLSKAQQEKEVVNDQSELPNSDTPLGPAIVIYESDEVETEPTIARTQEKISYSETSDGYVPNSSEKSSEATGDEVEQDEQELIVINKTAEDLVDSILTAVVAEMDQRAGVQTETDVTIRQKGDCMELENTNTSDVHSEDFASALKETVPENDDSEVEAPTEPIAIQGDLEMGTVKSSECVNKLHPTGAVTSIVGVNYYCVETDETTDDSNVLAVTRSQSPAHSNQELTVSPTIESDVKSPVFQTTFEIDTSSNNIMETENQSQQEDSKLVQQNSSRLVSLNLPKDSMTINEKGKEDDDTENMSTKLQWTQLDMNSEREISTVDLVGVDELPVLEKREAMIHGRNTGTVPSPEIDEISNQLATTDAALRESTVPTSECRSVQAKNHVDNSITSDTNDLIEIHLDVKLPDTNDNFVVAVLCPPDCREVLTAPIEVNHLDAQPASKIPTDTSHEEIEHAVKEIMESVDNLMNALELGLPPLITGSVSSANETNVEVTHNLKHDQSDEPEQNTILKGSNSLPDTTEIDNKVDGSTANTNCFVDSSSLSEHEDIKCNVTRLQSQSGKQSKSDIDRSTENVPTNDSLRLNSQSEDTSLTGESLNTSEHPKPSSVVEEVSYFLTTVAVAALSLGSSENASGSVSNPDFNTDIIEDASKYICSQPEPDSQE